MTRDTATDECRMVVEERDGVQVAKFTAEGFGNPLLLEDTFQMLISDLKHPKVVVDLSEIQSTMSLGIAVLVAAQGLAMIHDTRLAFAGVRRKVAKLISLTGADEALKVFDTVDDAVEWMRK